MSYRFCGLSCRQINFNSFLEKILRGLTVFRDRAIFMHIHGVSMEFLTKTCASPVCVCMQLRKAGRVVTQVYDHCLRPVGIRGTQFVLLKRIACMRRPFITDIGKVLCMDQTTATRNIGLLERAGFVAVTVHPNDARKKVVELTPEGQAKLEEAFPLWEEAQREIREYLGDDRLGSLCSLLQVLSDFSNE